MHPASKARSTIWLVVLNNFECNAPSPTRRILDAGAIQGAIELVANMIDMGVPQTEIQEHLRSTLRRADRIETKHPGLNWAVESGRAS